MCLRILTLSLFVLVALFARPEGGRSLSLEEDVELEKQLKLLNKPAIKSFKVRSSNAIVIVLVLKNIKKVHKALENMNGLK